MDHEIEVISDWAEVVTLNRELYLKHFRKNMQLSKNHINELVWSITPRLQEFGMGLRSKIAQNFELIQCYKWQVLEAEG